MRTFAGHPIQLFWQDLKVLEIALTQCQPDLIIELGTGTGASALFFSLFAPIVTCDIKDLRVCNRGLNKNIYVEVDIFSEYSINVIHEYFSSYKKIFLFCDNGDKPREFETFAPMLKKGDYIAVHDVGFEISEDQIHSVRLNNNLIPVIENLARVEGSLIRVFKKGE